MTKISKFLFETHGQSRATTAQVLCNKLVYASIRPFGKSPSGGRLKAPWHWYRFPFALRKQVLWSSPLECWFYAEDESATECMLHMGNYEPVAWVAPAAGDVFLDVGGYVGWYSIQAAKAVGSQGKVIVLEPDEINRRQLQKNLQLNQIENVDVLPKAVWSSSGSVPWRSGTEPVWHQVGSGNSGDTREAVSIDDLVESLGLSRLDWIKLDIEGAEVEAIAGATKALAAFRPSLFIEIHETREKITEMLESSGYAILREEYDILPQKHGWILAKPK